MGGDKIVLLDGAGANGGGAATNGLLSMIPGMFANLIGGNKMDPNLVAALMNGRNNQDGFGGANGWWLWMMACRARLPRRKNKLEGSDLRSRPRSFRWCGSHSKKYDSRIPVFPVWKKRNKNIIPVGGQ